MSDMKRDDLRVIPPGGTIHDVVDVSDADLAALGYVKLDVDVEALREALGDLYPLGIPTSPRPNADIMGSVAFLIELGVAVLAALDGESTYIAGIDEIPEDEEEA